MPPSSKTQKLQHHSVGYIDTPAFWDSLSKIWLTKYALRELNRRNSPSPSAYHRTRRPITRNILAERKNIRRTVSAADLTDRYSPRQLKDIKRLARHGGPNLRDLTSYPEPTNTLDYAVSSSQSNSYQKRNSSPTLKTKSNEKIPANKTSNTKKSPPKDPNFQQRLNDDDIYPYNYKYPDGSRPPLPADWDATNQRLTRYRRSQSPSSFPVDKYQKFVDEDADAHNEDAVKTKVVSALLHAMGAHEGAQHSIWFGNLDPMAKHITQTQPDYYYGAHPQQLDKQIRKDKKISKHIIPSSFTNLPIVPNLFMEAKGPNGLAAVLLRQACHDGAIGARAIHSLQAYGQDEAVYTNNISAISCTYHVGVLKMYAHSVARPNGPGTNPQYLMHQVNGWVMTSNKESFLQGATAFKNAMDIAREYRNAAIEHANEMVAQTTNIENEEYIHPCKEFVFDVCRNIDESVA